MLSSKQDKIMSEVIVMDLSRAIMVEILSGMRIKPNFDVRVFAKPGIIF